MAAEAGKEEPAALGIDEEVEDIPEKTAEEEKKRTIGKYDMGIVLGAGAFCKVRSLASPCARLDSAAPLSHLLPPWGHVAAQLQNAPCQGSTPRHGDLCDGAWRPFR